MVLKRALTLSPICHFHYRVRDPAATNYLTAAQIIQHLSMFCLGNFLDSYRTLGMVSISGSKCRDPSIYKRPVNVPPNEKQTKPTLHSFPDTVITFVLNLSLYLSNKVPLNPHHYHPPNQNHQHAFHNPPPRQRHVHRLRLRSLPARLPARLAEPIPGPRHQDPERHRRLEAMDGEDLQLPAPAHGEPLPGRQRHLRALGRVHRQRPYG